MCVFQLFSLTTVGVKKMLVEFVKDGHHIQTSGELYDVDITS